jgi:hypothetical protein
MCTHNSKGFRLDPFFFSKFHSQKISRLECSSSHFPYRYMGFPLVDQPSTDISRYFYIASKFIENGINSGGKLIHFCLLNLKIIQFSCFRKSSRSLHGRNVTFCNVRACLSHDFTQNVSHRSHQNSSNAPRYSSKRRISSTTC